MNDENKDKSRKHVFHIQFAADRERLVIGFANSGYKVRCFEEEDKEHYLEMNYFVEVSK
jgi:hypothetical protein